MTDAPYTFSRDGFIRRGKAVLCSLEAADENGFSFGELTEFGAKIAAALNAYTPRAGREPSFHALRPEERRYRVLEALDPALRGLLYAVGTVEIAELIAPALGIGEASDDKPAKALLLTTLTQLAAQVPEATRSEATFERFGKTMHRWVWSPRVDT